MYTDAYKIMVMCAEMEDVMSIKKYNKKSVKIRNIIIMFGILTGLFCSLNFLMPKTASAKQISSKLKNGVFTVSGDGDMLSYAAPKAAQKKKIKKIVVKKGVTSIPEDAFKDCSKASNITIASTVRVIGARAFFNTGVKKITIPKTTESIGQAVLQNCKKLQEVTMPGHFNSIGVKKNKENLVCTLLLGEGNSNIVNKVKFSTDFNADGLTDIGDCKNFEVLSTDSKYKSIDGCIYTKDGKTLVAIPYGKSEVKIAEGCEEVRVSSYSYASYRYVNSKAVYSGYNGCGQLRKITFPSTFKTLSTDDNISVYAGKRQQKYTDIQIELNTNYIDEDCVKLFWNSNQLWRKSLAAELERIGCVTIKDNMVILEDGGLCGYIGESENVEITIPNNVKYICENAFNSLSDATVQNFSIKSIVLNDNIEEIPVGAFCGNKNIKVYAKNNLRIWNYAFKNCGNYEIVKLG